MIFSTSYVTNCDNCNETVRVSELNDHLCKGKQLTVVKFSHEGKIIKDVYREHVSFDTMKDVLYAKYGTKVLFTMEYHG